MLPPLTLLFSRFVCYISLFDEQDGPTHQPVETVSGLRVFPNMDVMRPADPEETAAAYAASIDRKDGPTALILTRQNVRTLKEIPVRETVEISIDLTVEVSFLFLYGHSRLREKLHRILNLWNIVRMEFGAVL